MIIPCRSRRARPGECVRQQANSNATAIERWQRDHVEEGQYDVDDNRILEVGQHPLIDTFWQEDNDVDEQRCRESLQKVGGWSRRCDQHHVVSWIAQRPELHWNGLGVAEHEGRMEEEEKGRQQDGTERGRCA